MRSVSLFLILLAASSVNSERPKFSGPQVGEKLVPFEAKAVFGKEAGKQVKVLGDAKSAATLLVFVHQVSRPSIGLTRMLVDYGIKKEKEGLKTEVVFLSGDRTETEAWMNRARRALPRVRTLISTDGIEGPGSYGLNRLMAMTVLVGKDGKVTENFAITQPSINVDAPKIGHAILKVLADDGAVTKQPTLREMGFKGPRGRRVAMQPEREATYRRMISPVIQKNATVEQVDEAAKAVEEFAAKNPWFKEKLGKAANLIVNSDRLSSYGTPKAQEYLKTWAKAYAPTSDKTKEMKDKVERIATDDSPEASAQTDSKPE